MLKHKHRQVQDKPSEFGRRVQATTHLSQVPSAAQIPTPPLTRVATNATIQHLSAIIVLPQCGVNVELPPPRCGRLAFPSLLSLNNTCSQPVPAEEASPNSLTTVSPFQNPLPTHPPTPCTRLHIQQVFNQDLNKQTAFRLHPTTEQNFNLAVLKHRSITSCKKTPRTVNYK